MASRYITRTELARLAGVATSTITQRITAGKFVGILTPDGKKIDRRHPLVLDYLTRVEPKRGPRVVSRSRPARRAPTDPASPATEFEGRPDPFAMCRDLATLPNSRETAATGSAARNQPRANGSSSHPSIRKELADRYLYNLETGAGGMIPPGMADLGAMTLREVAERFGSLPALAVSVKVMKDFAAMRNTEGLAEQRRGTLVSRDAVTGTLIPLVDLAFRRLVTEAPGALTQQIIARVLHAGKNSGDLHTDVEGLIRGENSKILKACKARLTKAMPGVQGEGE